MASQLRDLPGCVQIWCQFKYSWAHCFVPSLSQRQMLKEQVLCWATKRLNPNNSFCSEGGWNPLILFSDFRIFKQSIMYFKSYWNCKNWQEPFLFFRDGAWVSARPRGPCLYRCLFPDLSLKLPRAWNLDIAPLEPLSPSNTWGLCPISKHLPTTQKGRFV